MHTLTQVFTHARGGCDNHRCHNKKPRIGFGTGDVNDVMARSDGLGFLVILNKSSELRFGLRQSELGFKSGRGQFSCVAAGCARAFVGSDKTVSIVKIVSLSPRVENLNLKKVIKVSYLNQESRQCFVFLGFLCLWTFYEHMYISHIRIMAMLHNAREVTHK